MEITSIAHLTTGGQWIQMEHSVIHALFPCITVGNKVSAQVAVLSSQKNWPFLWW